MRKLLVAVTALSVMTIVGCGGMMTTTTTSRGVRFVPPSERAEGHEDEPYVPISGPQPSEERVEPRRCTSERGDIVWCILGGIVTGAALVFGTWGVIEASDGDHTVVTNRKEGEKLLTIWIDEDGDGIINTLNDDHL